MDMDDKTKQRIDDFVASVTSLPKTVEGDHQLKMLAKAERTRAFAERFHVRLVETLRTLSHVIDHANRGAFDNGVTTSSGDMDEGDIMASRYKHEAFILLSEIAAATAGNKASLTGD